MTNEQAKQILNIMMGCEEFEEALKEEDFAAAFFDLYAFFKDYMTCSDYCDKVNNIYRINATYLGLSTTSAFLAVLQAMCTAGIDTRHLRISSYLGETVDFAPTFGTHSLRAVVRDGRFLKIEDLGKDKLPAAITRNNKVWKWISDVAVIIPSDKEFIAICKATNNYDGNTTFVGDPWLAYEIEYQGIPMYIQF